MPTDPNYSLPGAVRLAEMLQHLRDELAVTKAGSADDPIRLQVEEVELEVTVAIAKEGSGTGKLTLWVVELSGGGKYTSTNTHRLKIRLKPLEANSDNADPRTTESLKISNESNLKPELS